MSAAQFESGTSTPSDRPFDERRLGWALLLAVAVAWLTAAIWGSQKGYYPCYDSGAYVTVTRALLAGEGYVEGNHPQKPPFVLYPPGYVVPLAAAMRLFGDDWRALRLASVVPFGFAALLLIPWAFGHRLRPLFWPLAALLVGFGSFYTYSLRIQAEIPYLFWSLLTIGFAERALQTRRVFGWTSSLSILFGIFAIWTKPMGALLPFVILGCALVEALRRFLSKKREASPLRSAAPPLVFAALFGLLVAAPFAARLAIVQPDSFRPEKSHLLHKDWWDPDAGQRRLLSQENWTHVRTGLTQALYYYVPWSFLMRNESDWPTSKNRTVAVIGWIVLAGFVRQAMTRKWDGFDWFALGQVALIVSMPNQHPRYYTVVAPALAASFLGALEGAGLGLARLFRSGRTAFPVVIVLAGAIPLLAYDVREVRQYREWGEAWSSRSLNVYIGRAAAARAKPGDILLVDDHYGIHAITGFQTQSFHPAQRKSLKGWNVDDYLDRGGRIDVVATQVPEWEMAKRLFTHYGWEAYEIDEAEWWVTAKLRVNRAGPDRSALETAPRIAPP